MTQFAKVIDHKYLIRDLYSKAILNTDISIVKKHEKRIMDLQKEESREKEINTLKSEVLDLRNLILNYINKNKVEIGE